MAYAIKKYPSDSFTPPAPENEAGLPPILRGEWANNLGEGVHEILYWVDKDDPRSGRRGNPNDPQFSRWEYPLALWAGGQLFGSTTLGVEPPGAGGAFTILSPSAGSTITSSAPVVLSAFYPRPDTVTRVAYYLNGVYVGASVEAPYSIAFVPQTRGPAQLKAVAETSNGNEETAISFTIQ